jgi:hypothetical protein
MLKTIKSFLSMISLQCKISNLFLWTSNSIVCLCFCCSEEQRKCLIMDTASGNRLSTVGRLTDQERQNWTDVPRQDRRSFCGRIGLCLGKPFYGGTGHRDHDHRLPATQVLSERERERASDWARSGVVDGEEEEEGRVCVRPGPESQVLRAKARRVTLLGFEVPVLKPILSSGMGFEVPVLKPILSSGRNWNF